MEDTKRFEVFTKSRAFAVPASFILPAIKMDQLLGLNPRKAEVRVGEFTVDAYVFSGRRNLPVQKAFSQVLALSGIKEDQIDSVVCLLKEEKMPMLVKNSGSTPDVYCQKKDIVQPKHLDEEGRNSFMRAVISCYVSILELFSKIIGGINICLYTDLDDNYNMSDQISPVSDSDIIHIFVKARPPGDADPDGRYFAEVFGLPIDKDGKSARVANPTRGRGILVLDDDKKPLAQILGKNFYSLIPLYWNFDPVRSPIIFEKLLALIWDTYRTGSKEKKARIAKGMEFLEITSRWVGRKGVLIKKEISEIDEKIQSLQKDLAEALCLKKIRVTVLESFLSSSFVEESLNRLSEDFKKIRLLSGIEKISIVDEGIHVETGPIVISEKGKNYMIADSFTIRLSESGRIAIWTESSHHPKGIPHPHINQVSSPCLGNATNAIIQAVSEYRHFDTINYILRWLKEGYTPALAAVKVDEWPRMEEEKEMESTPKEVSL